MKLGIKFLSLSIVGLLGVFSLVNLTSDHTQYQKKSNNSIQSKALAVLKDNDCFACHSHKAELPFYASLPIIGSQIEKDVLLGTKNLNLETAATQLATNEKVSEAIVAKIEYAIAKDHMPPAKYTAMHWGSKLDADEKEILFAWIAQARTKDYGANLAAEKFKNEPVRPISNNVAVDDDKVSLGDDLYHDVRLSADNTVSCASCHDLQKGGVDRLNTSTGIGGHKGPINAPTVYNAHYNLAQFWDGRAFDLQAQASGPPLDAGEMGNKSFDEIVAKLEKDKALVKRFAKIYGEKGITQNSITDAIAEFEKTLVTPNAAFDKYLMGDENALTANQKEGYELFKGVGCANCHVGEALGGQSFEYVGIFGDYLNERGTEIGKADEGRAKFTNKPEDMFKQKTPTLRNVAVTQPYFHDASAKTLKEAVVMMSTYQIEHPLTDSEVDKVVDFLTTLTGEYKGVKLQ